MRDQVSAYKWTQKVDLRFQDGQRYNSRLFPCSQYVARRLNDELTADAACYFIDGSASYYNNQPVVYLTELGERLCPKV